VKLKKVIGIAKPNFDILIYEKGINKGIGRLKERGVITGKDSGRKILF